jgi:hypothetical protein
MLLEAPFEGDNNSFPEQVRSVEEEVEIGRTSDELFAEFRGQE